MKQFLFIISLIICTSKSFSQTSHFTVEANYPILIDDNYYGRYFDGIIDIGAKYRFAEFKTVKLGAAVNSGLLINNSDLNSEFSDLKITSYLLQPKIFAELDFFRIQPFIGIGYSFLIFDVSGTNNGIDASSAGDIRDGINLNFGTSYYLTEKIFMQVQYDFVKFRQDEGVPNDQFITNINILKLGLGFRL